MIFFGRHSFLNLYFLFLSCTKYTYLVFSLVSLFLVYFFIIYLNALYMTYN